MHFSFPVTFAKIIKVMAKEYTKKEFWDIYEKLPDELQEAIFSPDTAEHVNNACERHELGTERTSQVAKFTGRVLMGLLTPEEFKKRLKVDVELTQEQIKNIYREINRFVFMPVRETLSALYGVEIEPSKKPEGVRVSGESGQDKKGSEDRYREPIE